MQTFISNSIDDTGRIASDLADQIRGGGVVALTGELGAGKTTFVQEFAKALKMNEKIISPTFVLIRQYNIPNTIQMLYHLDLYRLENGFDNIGLGDLFSEKGSIVLIEWAEKITDELPRNTVMVKLENLGKNKRKITFE